MPDGALLLLLAPIVATGAALGLLTVLTTRPAHGYEITAWLRGQGFTDIAEGTVYALLVRVEQRGLVDVEKVPSEKGPPRRVHSLNAAGHEHLTGVWRTWSFLADRLEQLRREGERTMAKSLLELVVGGLEDEKQYRQHRARVKGLPDGYREAAAALERSLMHVGPTGDGAALVAMLVDLVDLLERSAADGVAIRDLVGEEPVEFAEASIADHGAGS